MLKSSPVFTVLFCLVTSPCFAQSLGGLPSGGSSLGGNFGGSMGGGFNGQQAPNFTPNPLDEGDYTGPPSDKDLLSQPNPLNQRDYVTPPTDLDLLSQQPNVEQSRQQNPGYDLPEDELQPMLELQKKIEGRKDYDWHNGLSLERPLDQLTIDEIVNYEMCSQVPPYLPEDWASHLGLGDLSVEEEIKISELWELYNRCLMAHPSGQSEHLVRGLYTEEEYASRQQLLMMTETAELSAPSNCIRYSDDNYINDIQLYDGEDFDLVFEASSALLELREKGYACDY